MQKSVCDDKEDVVSRLALPICIYLSRSGTDDGFDMNEEEEEVRLFSEFISERTFPLIGKFNFKNIDIKLIILLFEVQARLMRRGDAISITEICKQNSGERKPGRGSPRFALQ